MVIVHRALNNQDAGARGAGVSEVLLRLVANLGEESTELKLPFWPLPLEFCAGTKRAAREEDS